MPKISILVPVYNTEKYLIRCLDSIINQTFPDLEIICMDDGSTDESGNILDDYVRKDSRVRVIHKENSGYGNTMNQAISLACGEYIGIVESDDYIDSDMYECLNKCMDDYQLDFVKSDFYRLWDREDGTEEAEYKKLTESNDFYHRVMNPNEEWDSYYMEKFTWNALYRREFLIQNKICYNETPGASYQDNGFWFQTFYFARRIMLIDRAFYHYRQDNPSSSINSNKKTYAMKAEYDYIRDFLLKQNEKRKRLFKICFHFRIDGYLFTLSMLANAYKRELASIIKQECDFYEQMDEADYSLFLEYKKELIRQIKKNPDDYVDQQIYRNLHIYNQLKNYCHIIIYGAGSYGKKVYETIVRIVDSKVNIDFAVTSLEDKKKYYHSNLIKELAEFIEEKDDCVVILAVKEATTAYREMDEMLRRLQFSTVLSCKDLLF